MKAVEIKKNIYWVGTIDWDLREFHGYLTQRGTTYNAYLIVDEKIVLVDTTRNYLTKEMLLRISSIIDPSKIDYIISNHSEMDHSGALPEMMKVCKNATLLCSPNGEKNLKRHFDARDWNIKIVDNTTKINIGRRELNFVLTQMVHWPDSMATYIPQDKLLLPNDAFGQHIASHERYADEIGFDVVFEEAKKYYANIVMPYASSVNNALNQIDKLDIEMIAPSHGLIWRNEVSRILDGYKKWDSDQTLNKAVIIYDTMWGSTKLIAKAIYEAFDDKNVTVLLRCLKTDHISDIMKDIIDAKYICIGSPTLNGTTLPSVAAFLCYMKGLRPKKRVGLSFGSFGWAGQSTKEIDEIFKVLDFEIWDSIKIEYVPQELFLEKIAQDIKNKLI
ncbi:MAG: FprA family A-type flavoprotein [Parachlamydiales bacterium]|jgi:flavorubredoxin